MPGREIIRFVATGAVNTFIGLAVITLAQTVLSLGPYLSNACGYGAGLACSYALNSRWTFQAGAGSSARLARFGLAFALAYGVNLGLLHALLTIGAPWLLAQAGALVIYSAVFFALCRYVVFRLPASPAPAAEASR